MRQYHNKHVQRSQQLGNTEPKVEEIQREQERSAAFQNKYIEKYKAALKKDGPAVSPPGDQNEKEPDEAAEKAVDSIEIQPSLTKTSQVKNPGKNDFIYNWKPFEELPPINTTSVIGVREDVMSVKITDLTGSILKEYQPEKTTGYVVKLDDELEDGTYMMTMKLKDGSSLTRRLNKVNGETQNPIQLTALPKVKNYEFRNSGSFSPGNQAPYIVRGQAPSALGVNGAPAYGFHNVCEIRFDLDMNNRPITDFSMDIKRTRNNIVWVYRPAIGSWAYDPGGTSGGIVDDDPDNDDEYLCPDENSPQLYVFDGPGIRALPEIISALDRVEATEYIWAANFDEWVQFTDTATGTVFNDPKVVSWCNRIHLKKQSGQWVYERGTTYIREGNTALSP